MSGFPEASDSDSAMASGEHPGFPSLPSLSRFDLDMKDALWVLRRADRTNVASPMMLRRYKEPLGTFDRYTGPGVLDVLLEGRING